MAAIKLGLLDKLVMGNPDASRDWGYAGDYVEAMWRMLQQPEGDDYVVATGQTRSVSDLLAAAFDVVGIENWQDYVEHNPRLLRPAEVDVLVGDATKAREKLGWAPTVGFYELVRMMVESDLEQLQAWKGNSMLGSFRR